MDLIDKTSYNYMLRIVFNYGKLKTVTIPFSHPKKGKKTMNISIPDKPRKRYRIIWIPIPELDCFKLKNDIIFVRKKVV